MYKVNVPFTTGNFDLDINIQLKDDVVEKMVKSGTIYVVQRDGASKTYLDLCGVENDKGKKQLPDDFERKSLAFTEENLQAFVTSFTKALAPYGEATITGSEHVSGAEVSPMKRATEFVDALLGNAQNEAQLRGMVSMYGADGSEDRDALIKLVHDNVPGFKGKAKPKA
jgi:hypothetical protein